MKREEGRKMEETWKGGDCVALETEVWLRHWTNNCSQFH